MKELKRQAREQINDLIEKHCNPCTKQAELGVKDGAQFGRDYCNVECAVGRDLKKLGDYLITKGDKPMKVAVGMKPTPENYTKLKDDGLTDTRIMRMFGIDHNKLYKLKKEWGLVGKRGRSAAEPKKENKSFGEHLEEFAPKEMPTIQPDYSREIAKYEEEIGTLREANQALVKRVREMEQPQEINREMYQENAELKQTTIEQSKTITAWISEYKALQKKYESLVTYTKEIM